MLKLKSIGYYPLPRVPYEGISFEDLSQKLSSISVPTLCERMEPSVYSIHGCSQPAKEIQDTLEETQALLVGLDLPNLKRKICEI